MTTQKVTLDREQLEDWLYALETTDSQEGSKAWNRETKAITGIKEALVQSKEPEQEPAALNQVYRCKIKSRSRINKEIPREKQGWWADISAGQKLLLRQAVQADLDRCSLNDAHSKDPADYMCETQTNGSLVSKIALEYMNPEQNVFASTTPPQRKPLTDEQKCVECFAYGGHHRLGCIKSAHGIPSKE